MPPVWVDSNKTFVWLFNTERGLSVCIRLPNNIGLVYDLGCKDDFSPLNFIEDEILPHLTKFKESFNPGQLLVSHPHVDHIQEANVINESDAYNPGLVTLPHDIEVEGQDDEAFDFSRIENDDNHDYINEYKKIYEGRFPPLQSLKRQDCPTISQDVSCGLYYMRPPEVNAIHPSNDHEYCNGASLCMYLRHNSHSIWICGDVTPEAHRNIITGDSSIERRFTYFSNEPDGTPSNFHEATSSQPTPEELFDEHGLTLLVTPHHGLESGFSKELFDSIPGGQTQLNIVSEKRHLGDNDGTVDARYSNEDYSRGMNVDIDRTQVSRRMVSTRNGHHMLFVLGHDSTLPKVFMRSDPLDLMNLM